LTYFFKVFEDIDERYLDETDLGDEKNLVNI
jgi:hypothetical protein